MKPPSGGQAPLPKLTTYAGRPQTAAPHPETAAPVAFTRLARVRHRYLSSLPMLAAPKMPRSGLKVPHSVPVLPRSPLFCRAPAAICRGVVPICRARYSRTIRPPMLRRDSPTAIRRDASRQASPIRLGKRCTISKLSPDPALFLPRPKHRPRRARRPPSCLKCPDAPPMDGRPILAPRADRPRSVLVESQLARE